MHSLLAAKPVKLFFEKFSRKIYRYYRLLYNIWATVSLLLVLYFQYSFASPSIIDSIPVKYGSFIILVLPGGIIMIVSIIKYFRLLIGLNTLNEVKPSTELKRDGIHKYVRHPLYLGTILFIWGLFFIFPMLNNLIAAVIITVYVLVGIRFEEKKLIADFGNLYSDYMADVPMLIPDMRRLLGNKKGQPPGYP
jgi:methanethiol S-methyltransferase